ncbi:MAG: hypothetical protein U0359_38885 [Byssovorax sp.]
MRNRLRPIAPLLLASMAALAACEPAPLPPETPKSPATAAPGAPAKAGSAATDSAVLEVVEGTTVVATPPYSFDKLAPEQRVLAYHLAQASLAGDPIYTMQRSKQAWPVTQVVMRLLAAKERLDPDFKAKLVTYRKWLYLQHGMYEDRTGQKRLPPFTRAAFEAAVKAQGIEVSADLLAAMFDPKVAPVAVNKTPGEGKDALVESAANHYEGVTSKDLATFEEHYPLNGRVVRKDGAIVEEVYRAGGEGAAPGLAAKELGRVVGHLEDAIAVAPPAQQAALRHLVAYLRTGDNARFDQHDIAWLSQVFPVDYILGFVETYTDVRERKGTFEAVVGIPDAERDPPLQAMARNAAYFEQRMPWDAKWRRDVFRPPAAAAITVLAANGDGGPFTFAGVNLPNANAIRQQHGSKNFVVLSVTDVRDVLTMDPTIEEFAPAEARAELHRCARWLGYAAVGFHEVTGHGSGKVSPELKGDPSALLAPYYSAMEEGRAQRVADWLMGDPKTIEIGLLPDAGCAKIYPTFASMVRFVMLKYVPEGDIAEEDHLRAEMIDLGWLRDHGAITVEDRGGKTTLVVKDPDKWRAVSGELLAELQRIKATADRPALEALVQKYATKINTKWRDEVIARLKALRLPRSIATVPPILTPVRDAAGRIVDARAERAPSLDAYIEAMEQAWK